MRFVSHARNFEDVLLWRALKDVTAGFYVDTGPMRTAGFSITQAFYDAGWRGINLEPDPSLARVLRRDRTHDLNLPFAAGPADGQTKFDVGNDVSHSPVSETIVEFERSGPIRARSATRTLAAIWADYIPMGQDVHFLKVDARGQEGSVLASNDWERNRPWIVVVETSPALAPEDLRSEWEPILTEAGYGFVYGDGLNRFYLASEKAELAARLRHPPNMFDDFVTQAQFHAQEAAELLSIRAGLADQRAQAAEQALLAIRSSRTTRRLLRLAGVIERARTRYKASWIRRLGKTLTRPVRKRWKRRRKEEPAKIEYDAGFTVLHLRDFDLHFANGPLLDRRGIGRIAREQFRYLSRLAATERSDGAEIGPSHRRMIRFHSTLHWCQSPLEPGTVVMVHDVTPLLFPDLYPQDVIDEWNQRYRLIAQQAEHIVTISHSSAQAISDMLGIPLDRISVVHNGVSPIAVEPNSTITIPERPYVVYVGADDHNKNIRVVLEALRFPDAAGVDLVLVGDSPSMAKRIEAHGLAGRAHWLGALDDGDLGYVLSRAKALVFPSLYEGFGLPPLEAALLGIPSICSDAPAMNELIEAGALFCDPHSPHAWARALRHVAFDGPPLGVDSLRETVTEKFSWPNSIDQLVTVLDRFAKA
ncbi:hypothetical protein K32_03450 [Kaistia sp. 32K]|uniref:glycosyltransferase n=1 Tax=Kaistia sp. 32K TaxID=2795690 RepID=UPI001915E7F8|nr:glycosyltransferase [Kaistia sp. 32K]BCP51728.1 hypothetical protein K32_03450 [Kaistia sp. 32K]